MKTLAFLKKNSALCILLLMAAVPGFSKEGDGIPFKKLNESPIWKPTYNMISEITSKKNKSNYEPQTLFPSQDWQSGSYSRAWSQVQNYFPDRYIFINNNQEMMMHGLYKGKNCIEIFNGPYLQEAFANQNIFGKNVVKEYKKLSVDTEKKAVFDQKLGLLSDYFENKKSLDKLKKYLKDEDDVKHKTNKLYDEMMSALANEGRHMLAGALLHEGIHATLTDAQTANIQQDFADGYLSMELNELRAYMAEILYHCHFYNWAINNASQQWGDIANLLAGLEKCRRPKPPDLTQQEKEKIEEIKAKIKAHIAIIRVRLREINNSVQRMKYLTEIYRGKYMRNIDPKKDKISPESRLKENFNNLAINIARFSIQVGQITADMERGLKELEEILKEWNKYADCKIPSPPPPEPTDSLTQSNRDKQFPDAPIKPAEEIKKKAEEEIGRNYFIAENEGAYIPTSEFKRFSVSSGIGVSGIRMSRLNDYFDYINQTWDGNIGPVNSGSGVNLYLNYSITKNVGIGIGYNHLTASSEGILETYHTHYSSKNDVTGLLFQAVFRPNPLEEGLTWSGLLEPGWYFANYNENEEGYVTKGKGNSFGFRAAAGAEYMFLPQIGIQVLAGYRFANTGKLDATFFMPGNPPAELDYSGFFGEANLVVKF